MAKTGTRTVVPTAMVERELKALLAEAPAFGDLPGTARVEMLRGMTKIAVYLAAPEGLPANQLSSALLMRTWVDAVDFPNFVASLIHGVFHAIVDASVRQMNAYAELIRSAGATVDQFRSENLTDQDGRDWLVSMYPDVFEKAPSGKIAMAPNADLENAVRRLRRFRFDLNALEPADIESKLVPAARRHLAGSRQQVLSTMVLMGINRIVVTDGRLAAKLGFRSPSRSRLRKKA